MKSVHDTLKKVGDTSDQTSWALFNWVSLLVRDKVLLATRDIMILQEFK